MTGTVTGQLGFFCNPPQTPRFSTLSLHDALPISHDALHREHLPPGHHHGAAAELLGVLLQDRKSTRLNSSHVAISYAVFCLKKKHQVTQALRTNLYFTFSPLMHVCGEVYIEFHLP